MPRADPDRVLRDLGRRFAELRVERGLTQEAMAERLDISTKYLQRLERGRSMTLRTLIEFSNRFNVPLTALFAAPASRIVKKGRPPQRSSRARRP